MALSLGEVFAILAFVAQVVQILSDWAQVHYRHHYLDRAQLDLHVGDEARVGDGYRDGANALAYGQVATRAAPTQGRVQNGAPHRSVTLDQRSSQPGPSRVLRSRVARQGSLESNHNNSVQNTRHAQGSSSDIADGIELQDHSTTGQHGSDEHDDFAED